MDISHTEVTQTKIEIFVILINALAKTKHFLEPSDNVILPLPLPITISYLLGKHLIKSSKQLNCKAYFIFCCETPTLRAILLQMIFKNKQTQ